MDGAGDTIGVQSLQDIESYLTNFNKEISDASDHRFVLAAASASDNPLYTDASAIYNSPSSNVGGMKLERSGLDAGVIDSSGTGDQTGFDLAVGADGLIGHVSPQQLLALQGAPIGATPVSVGADDVGQDETPDSHLEHPDTSVAQSSGAGTFQTVTIVPSEVNPSGEVSYVLIVSQQDDKEDDATAALSVYDFKEEAKTAVDCESPLDKIELEQQPRKSGRRASMYADLNSSVISSSGAGGGTHLMCNYCNYTSPKRYLLARHLKAHSEERPHKCTICSRMFKTIPALQNHVNTHTGVRPQHCKECDASFTTSGELVRHVRYRHTYEKPHRCTECSYASVELSKLRRHIRSHTGERPYQCQHCPYASPDTYKLKRHLRVHTGEKPYECDICNLRFTQSNSLKAHKLIHTGHKPVFQCELCPTTCGRKTDLKYHVMKLHTSDRPLQCRKCGKAFPDRYTYKIHLKTHDGEKCFRCELCPYSALDQRHLESHILTHTGEKPYTCDYCDQSYRQKQLLRRHINLYHVPGYVPPAPLRKLHQCSHCHKQFAHRGNLMRHLALHDPTNTEYQEALHRGDASTGDEGDYEGGDDEGTSFLELHNAVPGSDGGVQLTELDGDQMQVKLVRVAGQEGEQVYIQIGNHEMEMLTQQQAEQVQKEAGLLIGVDSNGSATHSLVAEDVSTPAKTEPTPAKKPRGRPRKYPKPESDDDYMPVSRSPRGRGRGRGAGRGSVTSPGSKEHVTVEDGPLQSDDDIVTVNSVKLGKRRRTEVSAEDDDNDSEFAPGKKIKLENAANSTGDEPSVLELSSCFAFDEVEPE